jgi:hypothetical protein
MPSRRLLMLAAAATALPLAFAACGADDANDDAGPAATSTTTAPQRASGTGTGTVVVADKTFAFAAKPCTIDGDNVKASGKGTIDGKAFTAAVERSANGSIIESVQVAITPTETDVATNFAASKSGAKLTVSGDQVKGTMAFSGTGGLPTGDGTLDLTCKAS